MLFKSGKVLIESFEANGKEVMSASATAIRGTQYASFSYRQILELKHLNDSNGDQQWFTNRTAERKKKEPTSSDLSSFVDRRPSKSATLLNTLKPNDPHIYTLQEKLVYILQLMLQFCFFFLLRFCVVISKSQDSITRQWGKMGGVEIFGNESGVCVGMMKF